MDKKIRNMRLTEDEYKRLLAAQGKYRWSLSPDDPEYVKKMLLVQEDSPPSLVRYAYEDAMPYRKGSTAAEIAEWFAKNYPIILRDWDLPNRDPEFQRIVDRDRISVSNQARNIQGQAYRPAVKREAEEAVQNLKQDVQNKSADLKTWLENLVLSADQSIGNAAKLLVQKLYGGRK